MAVIRSMLSVSAASAAAAVHASSCRVRLWVDEPRPDSHARNLRAEIREGVQWTYRHRTLGPLAASTHV